MNDVTVSVLEAGKSKALKHTLTNGNGFFELTGLSSHKLYTLTLTHAGYKDTTFQLPPIKSSPLHLGQIALISLAKELEEVQLTAQKPLIEQDLDKLTYNVDADPESKTASALEILHKIPLITIDADDNLQLNGNSSYRVLINGKTSSLFLHNPGEVLQNMAASAIKTIEILTIPPSRYEAVGAGGIINITTYKKTIGGYNGGVNVRGSSPSGLSTNSHITSKRGRAGLSGSFGYNSSTRPHNNSHLTRIDQLQQNRLEQTGRSASDHRSLNASGELSYEVNSMNLITANYSMNSGYGLSDLKQAATLLDAAGEPAEAYRRLNSGRDKNHGQDIALDYQHNSRRNEAQQLAISYRWNKSLARNTTDFVLQPLFNYKDQQSTTSNDDRFNEHTLQADYLQPIKKHTLELGVHSIFRQNSSDYFYKNQDTATGAFLLDSSQSNSFDYSETIHAAYASLNIKAGKWGFKAGARLEGAKIDARFISSGTVARQNFTNLIPNITLSRQLKGISMFKLSYTQRIQRPDLYYLDPYVDLTDPWNISYGNPDLQPALAHVFQAAYNTFIKKTSIHVNFFHQLSNNTIQQYTTLGADTIARTTYGNLGKNRNYSLSASGTTTLFSKLSISLNGSSNYAQYSSMINGKAQTNEGFSCQASATLNLRLKNWRASTNMGYNAPHVLAQGRSASYVSNSVTVTKYFLKNNKASIGLSVTSPFRERRRTYTEIDDPAFFLRRESSAVIRRFNLAFHYRFGKVQ